MTLLSSLTNRLFAAMALLAVVSIASATYYATAAVTAQAEGELRRGLEEAGILVEEYRTQLLDHFSREARLVADLPLLKAAVAEQDPPTVKPIAEYLKEELVADFFVVTNPRGIELARIETTDQDGILQVVSVPIYSGEDAPVLFGTLSVGFSLDARTAYRFKALTNSEIVFGAEGTVRAGTLGSATWPLLAPLLERGGVTPSIQLEGHDYIAATRPLPPYKPATAGASAVGPAPTAIILRSRTDRLEFLSGLHKTVLLMAIGAVLAATLASYAIARTVTRPLGVVTNAMREMASTGDLTRRIHLPSGARWEDEDARLLASSFNSMTDSIARFQREAAQRERLSSLGRLSTVVAHEIRNPLMIIKTALRTLRQGDAGPEAHATAVADIDGEVERLNRIVSEVLDFARPIRFDLAEVDLNALCTDAARAASADGNAGGIRLDLARLLPPVTTDAERLRLALINVLTNARHAVEAADRQARPDAIRLSTRPGPAGRVTIQISDRGAGIAADDLARIFDPFFTTRRTGTGLGLAITRNIIEGLGGSITITSKSGHGTDVRIDLAIDQTDVQRLHSPR
ncbi:MAG TPA: ATP-binding protein [Vicinamibacterales bacterium]|nr:ATP-binding protein [Vicinamibacterales bacterium]